VVEIPPTRGSLRPPDFVLNDFVNSPTWLLIEGYKKSVIRRKRLVLSCPVPFAFFVQALSASFSLLQPLSTSFNLFQPLST
jgi:hypothetical protein